MSIENHPNFHAVKFALTTMVGDYKDSPTLEHDIVEAFHSCLRGKALDRVIPVPHHIISSFVVSFLKPENQTVIDFTEQVEQYVDQYCE